MRHGVLSSNALPVETPPARKPFSQLAAFAQQILSSGIPLEWAVQAASTNMATSLSCTASGRGCDTGKYNSGTGMEGVYSGPEVLQVWEVARSLFCT